MEPGSVRDGALRSMTPIAFCSRNSWIGSARTVATSGSLPMIQKKLSRKLADAAAGHDLDDYVGGVSTGEADYVRDAIERVGNLVFWRVAIRPRADRWRLV